MQMLEAIITKVFGWMDDLATLVKEYSGAYSKYIIYIFGVLALAKIFKIKLNLNLGKAR